MKSTTMQQNIYFVTLVNKARKIGQKKERGRQSPRSKLKPICMKADFMRLSSDATK